MTKDLTFLEIAREYFPEADDTRLSYIMWEYTGYPGFFKGDPEECFRKQLQEHKDKIESHREDSNP